MVTQRGVKALGYVRGKRRLFQARVSGALESCFLNLGTSRVAGVMHRFSVEMEALAQQIETLASISESPAPVVTRILFSDADLAARRQVEAWCQEAGLETRTDAAGNGFARWVGAEPDLPPIATGSHIDAIPNAGRFDGVVGVLGGLAAIAALQRAGYRPRRSVELIVFTAEEPTRFGLGCLGSRLLGGAIDPLAAGNLADGDGRTFDQWRAGAGCGGPLAGVRLGPGAYQAFVELHIEQGPILEREGLDIGAVEKIAAPAALRVRLVGEGGHAGAVLMPVRHDALLAGAEIALAVERAALESGSVDAVGTTGVFRVAPGAINSVPSFAELEIDLRDTDLPAREGARAAIERAIGEVCGRRGVPIHRRDDQRRPTGHVRRAGRQTDPRFGAGGGLARDADDQSRLPRYAFHGARVPGGDDFYPVPGRGKSSARRVRVVGSDPQGGLSAGRRAGRNGSGLSRLHPAQTSFTRLPVEPSSPSSTAEPRIAAPAPGQSEPLETEPAATRRYLLPGFGVLVACLFAGQGLKDAFALILPGNILGLFILLTLLFTGVVPLKWVEATARLLLWLLPFLFLPIFILAMKDHAFWAIQGRALCVAVVTGTVLLWAFVGHLAQSLLAQPHD